MSVTVRMSDGDIEVGSPGDQRWVSGAAKAAQDLLEEVLLPYDASRDRGNELFNANGTLAVLAGAELIGQAAVKSMLQSATQRLMRAQSADQYVDDAELIRKLGGVLVTRHPTDPTAYAFLINVEVDDENIAVARAIRMGHLGDTPRPLVGGYDP